MKEFLDFAERNANDESEMFYCPCAECLNQTRLSAEDIYSHLICEGFCKSYTLWICHGEKMERQSVSQQANEAFDDDDDDVSMHDQIEDMIRDVGQEAFKEVHGNMRTDAEKPLYPGSEDFQLLNALLELVSLKARHGWSDISFTETLELLKRMFPKGNVLPSSYYDAKKILCPLGMKHRRIHACPNDCILYRKQFKELEKCPVCEKPRYKLKKTPAKVLWYLPIVPRLKRLFANENNAKNLTWHADDRIVDGKLRHPADSPQWKKIDRLFPSFGIEPRNLRLGLSTDGMNPYGSLSSIHSSWPVFLVIYNLSPLLCMKRKYIMLSMLISGPRQPGNDIDVYLKPLIEDLKELWEDGVDVFDANRKEVFKMRAMIFCTINDFPAYGNLAGYSVKGHKACPICEEGTCFHQLQHGRKTVYLGHRRFLPQGHPYRRLKKAFYGGQDHKDAPEALTGEQVYERVKNINVVFGKSMQSSSEKNIWKKRSVFFDLPYWKNLYVRHCIDVMHVEKNVCDSIVGTLLNIQGSSKDGV